MKTIKRYDQKKLTLGKNVKETPQGFLVIPAFTARTGIQSYKMSDGTILKEFRSEDEVFSEKSMSSLRMAAVTDGHPKDDVGPENAHELMLGHTNGAIEKVKDGDEFFLKTHLVITHKRAIDAIRAGKAELSNGYNTDLVFTPGEHNGQKYDAIQKNIVNNHIAIVWKGRAGKKASLRLDEKDAILLDDEENFIIEPNKKESSTMKLKIGDKEFEVADEVGAAVKDEMAKLSKSHKDSDSKVGELEAEVEILKTQKTNLVAKADSLESDLEKSKSKNLDEVAITKRINETISVRDNGSKILDAKTVEKINDMSNEEIKVAVIKADSPKVDEEKLKDTSYVNARYDHIVENFSGAAKKVQKVGDDIVNNRDEDDKDEYVSPEQKRADSMKADQEASTGPLTVKKD